MKDVARLTDVEGLAALGICESLLLALLNSKSSANETCVMSLRMSPRHIVKRLFWLGVPSCIGPWLRSSSAS